MTEDDPFPEIEEYDPARHGPETPPYKTYKEFQGSGADFLIISEGERRELMAGPNIEITAPDGFDLSESNLEVALRQLSETESESIEALLKSGVDYSDKPNADSGVFSANDIVGTYSETGWAGLIGGTGKSRGRVYTAAETLKFAQKILNMGPLNRRKFASGIYFSMHEGGGKRRFFVDKDGQHRVVALKALAILGCEVRLSNYKVNVLKD